MQTGIFPIKIRSKTTYMSDVNGQLVNGRATRVGGGVTPVMTPQRKRHDQINDVP